MCKKSEIGKMIYTTLQEIKLWKWMLLLSSWRRKYNPWLLNSICKEKTYLAFYYMYVYKSKVYRLVIDYRQPQIN